MAGRRELNASQQQALTEALLALSNTEGIQEQVATALTNAATPVENRRLLFASYRGRGSMPFPPNGSSARQSNCRRRCGPRPRGGSRHPGPQSDAFDGASRSWRPAATFRLNCGSQRWNVSARGSGSSTPAAFALLKTHLSEKVDPLVRVAAARRRFVPSAEPAASGTGRRNRRRWAPDASAPGPGVFRIERLGCRQRALHGPSQIPRSGGAQPR